MNGCLGLILDLDGVVVHTDRYHFLAWKVIADRLGIRFDETVNNRLRGVSRSDSLAILLEGYHGALPDAAGRESLCEEKNRIYRAYLEQMSPADVEDDVRETLLILHTRGYRLGIGSSSRNARLILQRTAMTDLFDVIADGTEITHSKPDPEVFLLAAEKLKLPPERCAVVEDAAVGIRAAKACGMTAVALGSDAAAAQADLCIWALPELLAAFPGSGGAV